VKHDLSEIVHSKMHSRGSHRTLAIVLSSNELAPIRGVSVHMCVHVYVHACVCITFNTKLLQP
jgi:hypothetical protein